jgi:hypothetical protein
MEAFGQMRWPDEVTGRSLHFFTDVPEWMGLRGGWKKGGEKTPK